MTDRVDVIKGLEFTKAMLTFNPTTGDEIAPENLNELDKITYDACVGALALLKEQDAVEPFHKCIGNEFSLVEDSHFDYCPYCGKPITWAKQEGR